MSVHFSEIECHMEAQQGPNEEEKQNICIIVPCFFPSMDSVGTILWNRSFSYSMHALKLGQIIVLYSDHFKNLP